MQWLKSFQVVGPLALDAFHFAKAANSRASGGVAISCQLLRLGAPRRRAGAHKPAACGPVRLPHEMQWLKSNQVLAAQAVIAFHFGKAANARVCGGIVAAARISGPA